MTEGRGLRGWTWVAIVALGLVVAGCGAGVVPPVHSEQERLDVARKMMRGHDYVPAIELLKTYVQNNAGSADVDEAIYLLGECYVKVKDFTGAELEFERMLRDYPESDSSGSASFQLGEALFGQSRGPDFDQEYTFKALDQWESYERSYPGHWLQPEAKKRIGEVRSRLAAKLLKTGHVYLGLKLGEPARVYFQRVVDEFGDTPQAGEASICVALAEEVSGNRAGAIAKLRELETQYPGQPIAARAARERARLER